MVDPSPEGKPPPPRKIEPTERVPRLRGDLKIQAASAEDDSVIEVEDPVRKRKYLLRDFEVSLARMLNGERTAKDVVDAAGQIGLPLTIDSLSHFLEKMEGYEFLEVSPMVRPIGRGSILEPRREWNDEVRHLYQTAIRQYRSDEPEQAKQSLAAMLEQAPGAHEALALLSRVDQALAAGANPPPGRSFSEIYENVERTWFEGGQAAAAVAALSDSVAGEVASFESHTGRNVLIAFGLILGIAIVVVAIPFAYSATVPAVVRAPRSTTVKFPKSGRIASVNVTDGQLVAKGAVLAAYDLAETRRRREGVEARLAAAEAKLKRASANPRTAKARADLARAQAVALRARNDVEKATVKARGKKSAAVAVAEKKLASARASAARAQKAYDASLAATGLESIQREIALATQERAAARGEEDSVVIEAPEAGQLIGLSVRPGTVTAGTLLAKIEDSQILVATIPLEPGDLARAKPGQAVTFTCAGKPFSAQVQRITDKGVEAQVENPSRALRSGSEGFATVDLGRVSLLARM